MTDDPYPELFPACGDPDAAMVALAIIGEHVRDKDEIRQLLARWGAPGVLELISGRTDRFKTPEAAVLAVLDSIAAIAATLAVFFAKTVPDTTATPVEVALEVLGHAKLHIIARAELEAL